ncbi:MAG: hypothetical protein ABIB97_04265 [Patescibacteria group bacterium]
MQDDWTDLGPVQRRQDHDGEKVSLRLHFYRKIVPCFIAVVEEEGREVIVQAIAVPHSGIGDFCTVQVRADAKVYLLDLPMTWYHVEHPDTVSIDDEGYCEYPLFKGAPFDPGKTPNRGCWVVYNRQLQQADTGAQASA